MGRFSAFITIVFLVSFAGLCRAQSLDTIRFDGTNTDYSLYSGGAFTKPGLAEPSETIFVFGGENKRYPIDINYFDQYTYLGRTGDKSFELQRIFKGPGVPPHKNVIKMYFEENSTYQLKITAMNTSCTKDDKVLLKMLKLQGNNFEYMVILPPCIDKYMK